MSGRRPAPGSALAEACHRLAMAGRVPSLRRRREPAAEALGRALATAAGGRLDPGERAWAARVERRRAELASPASAGRAGELGVVDLPSAVRWMSVPPALGRFLMRLVRELGPESALELGTGFGISGAYQAAGLQLNDAGRLITVDVSRSWSQVAADGFSALGLERIEARAGDAEAVLAAALADVAPLDYAFVDSDHREAQTVAAFERMLPYLRGGAVVVFDDIGFASVEMQRAWRSIAGHPRVAAAPRFGRMGAALISP